MQDDGEMIVNKIFSGWNAGGEDGLCESGVNVSKMKERSEGEEQCQGSMRPRIMSVQVDGYGVKGKMSLTSPLFEVD